MQGILAVPNRRAHMGESHIPKDDERAYSIDELKESLVFKSEEEAIKFYEFLVRSVALRVKVAFLTDLWSKIKGSPELTGALAATQDGRTWLDLFRASELTFRGLTQPNRFINLQRSRTLMETVVLPKQYGITPRGRLPNYIHGSTSLTYMDVVGPSGSGREYNFGDLRNTTLGDDLDAIDKLAKFFGHKGLSQVTETVILILVIGVVATAILAGIENVIREWKKPAPLAPAPNPITPEVNKILEKLDPEKAADIVKQSLEVQKAVTGRPGEWSETIYGLTAATAVFFGGSIAYHLFTKE